MNIDNDTRSAIMKFVSENPRSTAPQIIKSLGLNKSNGAKLLMRLWGDGALYRNEVVVQGIDSTGKAYKNKSFAYTIGKPVKTVVPAGIQQLPGYYSQSGGKWNARSGGGQGSGRRTISIGSTLA